MGTDCTMTLEAYDKGFCKWHVLEVVEISRDYELFGLLAGIRGTEFECQIEPRGFPSDVCAEIIASARAYGYHTPSFLYGDEVLARARGRARARLKPLLGALKKYPGMPPERLRFVFWFDS